MKVIDITDVENLLLNGTPTVQDLHAVWRARRPIPAPNQKKSAYSAAESSGIPWLEDARLAKVFVHHALCAEEYFLVVDAATEILRLWPNATEGTRTSFVYVRVDYAIALTRLGFTSQARLQLEPCAEENFRPRLGRTLRTNVFLQLGHILRDEWHDTEAKASRQAIAQQALDFYRQAMESDPERWETMVSAASAAFVLAADSTTLREQAQATARGLLKGLQTRDDSEECPHIAIWARATLHAILGQLQEAFLSFQALDGMDGATTSYLAETRFQARFLAEAHGEPKDYFKSAFPPLQLVVFAGHIPDRPNGRVRLPPASIPAARAALLAQLQEMEARVGLVSASAGADLLFTDALRQLGKTFHLVLPWSQEEFRRTSVMPHDPAGVPFWNPLFDQALEAAASIREIGQVYEPSEDLGWQFMMEVTAGIALRTARSLRLDIQPLVLWDGHPGAGAGGTDSFHGFWKRKLGLPPIVVPTPPLSTPDGPHESERNLRNCERSVLHQEVKSMLFADIVGYSKLNEKAIPAFIEIFLERAAHLATTSTHAPCSLNTWGDAIYAVFDFAQDAGLFALELARMVQDGEQLWLGKGLYWESRSAEGNVIKHPLNIRIGLHTGPVVMHFDPIVRRLGFTGAHVNRAARIEPVAEPGQVFASEEFAAMVELSAAMKQRETGNDEAGSGFVCEYAGSMELAKGYPGLHRIYRVVARRVFAIERLAQVVHENFRKTSRSRGPTSTASQESLRPWDELTEDLRESNRAQVADIPNKLRLLGFALSPSYGLPPSQIEITAERLESMAIREHDRWMEERRRQGWTHAADRDDARKLHPLLVPWEELDEKEREKDRDAVRNLPALIEEAGFRLTRIR